MQARIVLDAMGSDNRPFPEVEGAVISANQYDLDIILVGDETQLADQLAKQPGDKSHVRIVHAPEAIAMDDHIQEARAKKLNTMQVGMTLVKNGEADAFVTAGNTGMTMYFASRVFGFIPGVLRPALCVVFPVQGGKCVVLDVGANAECRPEFLVQFARMGAVYSRLMVNPSAKTRIGLISNGEEAGKGNELVKAAGPLLAEQIEGFLGNIEGKEIFAGAVDVAVTDGFTGNVLLKSTEAVSRLILQTLKTELMGSLRTKLGAALAKPAFNTVKKMLDPSETGAAPLLGINGLVFVGHGRSEAKAIVSAVNQARLAIEAKLLENLIQSIETK